MIAGKETEPRALAVSTRIDVESARFDLPEVPPQPVTELSLLARGTLSTLISASEQSGQQSLHLRKQLPRRFFNRSGATPYGYVLTRMQPELSIVHGALVSGQVGFILSNEVIPGSDNNEAGYQITRLRRFDVPNGAARRFLIDHYRVQKSAPAAEVYSLTTRGPVGNYETSRSQYAATTLVDIGSLTLGTGKPEHIDVLDLSERAIAQTSTTLNILSNFAVSNS